MLEATKCNIEGAMMAIIRICVWIRGLEERRPVANEWAAINNSSSGGAIEKPRARVRVGTGTGRVLERHVCKGHVP